MKKQHHYQIVNTWTGNIGYGTSSYTSYERDHIISSESKLVEIPSSSDPSFRGNSTKYNPEELLVASLSACHMLWYLHLCADAGIVVVSYQDNAQGIMMETENGGGHFTEVNLFPEVTITDEALLEKAIELHHLANSMCFIANSVKFPIHHHPKIKVLVI